MASPFSVSVLAIALLLGVTSACDLETCASGKRQSPVNILKNETLTNGNLKPLTTAYKAANSTTMATTLGLIHYEQSAGVLMVDGKNYTLKQMHWHCPSEHQINGKQFAAELHLVHQDNDCNSTVVGILYSYGNADPFLSKLKVHLDKLAKKQCGSEEKKRIPLGTINAKQISKNTRKYYRYMGSVTTPPCYENVL